MQRPSVSRRWRRKHRSWLVFALFGRRRELQHRVGAGTLVLNTADSNTAVGAAALLLNTTGTQNVAVGTDALVFNDSGSFNTANGTFALFNHTTGDRNTAVGTQALFSDVQGVENTAIGYQALYSSTTIEGNFGAFNTASGSQALYSNTTGFFNTAFGGAALYSNTTANDNTAAGSAALFENVIGIGNTAVGRQALLPGTGDHNTAIGAFALAANSTGNNNIALGFQAGYPALTTGDNNIDIGSSGGNTGESGMIRIGVQGTQTATFIAGISGTAVTGAAVVVNASGQLGVPPSSKRFKDEIKPMDKASEAILALKPVTFRYKQELDPKRARQFGLVAEDMAQISPDLVVRDESGEVYTVRYDAVNAMLPNEFLKEHCKVEELKNDFEAKIAQQQKEIQTLTGQLKEQAAQIQKVSAHVEMSEPAPQVVVNKP